LPFFFALLDDVSHLTNSKKNHLNSKKIQQKDPWQIKNLKKLIFKSKGMAQSS
jgi:hypothetical protein